MDIFLWNDTHVLSIVLLLIMMCQGYKIPEELNQPSSFRLSHFKFPAFKREVWLRNNSSVLVLILKFQYFIPWLALSAQLFRSAWLWTPCKIFPFLCKMFPHRINLLGIFLSMGNKCCSTLDVEQLPQPARKVRWSSTNGMAYHTLLFCTVPKFYRNTSHRSYLWRRSQDITWQGCLSQRDSLELAYTNVPWLRYSSTKSSTNRIRTSSVIHQISRRRGWRE